MLAEAAPSPRSTVTAMSWPDRSTSRAPGRPDTVDADRRTVERHRDPVRIQRHRGDAHRGQHPAPVRVGAEQRRLDKAVAGDGAGAHHGVVLAAGAGDGDDDPLGDALGVGLQLCAQVVADAAHRFVEFVLAGRDLAGARGQQQHGVVGRAAAVDVEAVERGRGGPAQRAVQGGGVGDRVGGDDDEHGGQRRRQHAGALRHGADGPVVPMVQRNLFGHRVGGHDGVGGLVAARSGRRPSRARSR